MLEFDRSVITKSQVLNIEENHREETQDQPNVQSALCMVIEPEIVFREVYASLAKMSMT